MSESEIGLLETVLVETEAAIASVAPTDLHLPTPCGDFEVARLVDHLVGWANSFAMRLKGVPEMGDPNSYRVDGDPTSEFRQAAQTILGAYRDGGEEAQRLPVGFVIMEFLVHGWDLGTATGRSVTFSPAAADLGLAAGRLMLKPDYRGPGKSFGYEVEVPDGAGPVDRLVAFMGRDPGWGFSQP